MAFNSRYTTFDKLNGEDYSEVYAENTSGKLYIGKVCPKGEKMDVIMFKPFLKDFSIDMNVKTAKSEKSSKDHPKTKKTQLVYLLFT